jgi:hypothetical protein
VASTDKPWSEMSDASKEVELKRLNREFARELLEAKTVLLGKIKADVEQGNGSNSTYLAEAYALISGSLNSYTPTAG